MKKTLAILAGLIAVFAFVTTMTTRRGSPYSALHAIEALHEGATAAFYAVEQFYGMGEKDE